MESKLGCLSEKIFTGRWLRGSLVNNPPILPVKILQTCLRFTGGHDLFKSLFKGEGSSVPSLGIPLQTWSNIAKCLSAPEPVILRHVGRQWTVDTAAGRGAVASLHCGRAHARTCDRRHRDPGIRGALTLTTEQTQRQFINLEECRN